MTSNVRSFGKMETYEPEDKSFSKHILREGHSSEKPNDGSVCSIIMYQIDPVAIFPEDLCGYSFDHEIEVTLGDGDSDLSELLDKVLLSMVAGELAYVKCKVDTKGQALSELERSDKLAGLKFKVELRSFNRVAESAELAQDERVEWAQNNKERGTELFRRGNDAFAVKRWRKALRFLSDMEPVDRLPGALLAQYRLLKCQCHLNLSACHLKCEEFRQAAQACDEALAIEPDNVKGLFRRGKARARLHLVPEARADFVRVLEIEPDNKAARTELSAIETQLRQEKKMYERMFAGGQ